MGNYDYARAVLLTDLFNPGLPNAEMEEWLECILDWKVLWYTLVDSLTNLLDEVTACTCVAFIRFSDPL